MAMTQTPARPGPAWGIAERNEYKTIYERLRPMHQAVLQDLVRKIRLLLEESGQSPAIKSRVKRFDGYYEKLLKLFRKEGEQAMLTDLLGIRIVCPFLEDRKSVV